MRYQKIWNKIVTSDEHIEFEFSISWRYIYIHLSAWMLLSLATVWIYGLGVLIFAIALFYFTFYIPVSNAYAFTNKRILIHRGWLSTSVQSVDYGRITDVHTSQNFVEKIVMGTGQLAIDTAGGDDIEVKLIHIANPYKVKQKLAELIDRASKHNFDTAIGGIQAGV
ncbi:MAG: hypothetical protein A2664_03755 [Candidatus Taylorbacteria bacterium RIFCSPHIGHO2_01_FULL_46_22b]|uniref:YdbS-like PH domain-containing protein n=1 Tax=Candidatus Taylorbacteria bacterium RIFCSPHIGHO2_01_FULL_46_22b TaxID=1802301 RepID=A0A1G2M1L2_9BACT|nr:MAG: hypothetical protein A2664_03755 [Candidatus Taylorbacteria bacterium RIFCSPHIGHO2_01_FULL_46_22b]